MKRWKALTLTLLMLLSVVLGAAACGGQGDTIDKNKTQLYVGVYDGALGYEWMKEYKAAFEAKYEDVSLEDGKMGVEVVIRNRKTDFDDGMLTTGIAPPISGWLPQMYS